MRKQSIIWGSVGMGTVLLLGMYALMYCQIPLKFNPFFETPPPCEEIPSLSDIEKAPLDYILPYKEFSRTQFKDGYLVSLLCVNKTNTFATLGYFSDLKISSTSPTLMGVSYINDKGERIFAQDSWSKKHGTQCITIPPLEEKKVFFFFEDGASFKTVESLNLSFNYLSFDQYTFHQDFNVEFLMSEYNKQKELRALKKSEDNAVKTINPPINIKK